MADLFEYIKWRGDLTFEQVPFNKIDALIFSQLIYIDFSGIIDSSFSRKKTLADATNDFFNTIDLKNRLDMGFFINQKTPDFLLECAKSKRYENVLLSGFRQILDKEENKQFAAITFNIDKLSIVTYRGTDDTLIGWRENFSLAYSDHLPSQQDALNYLSQASFFLNKNIIITGHSKGANLALNTGVKCNPKLTKRIQAVYNFDGPGFSQEFYNTSEYKNLASKIISFYPKYAIVGMLFKHPSTYNIVNSNRNGLMQHDILSWEVSATDFDYADDFAEHSYILKKSVKEWLESFSIEERKRFVNALFEVINASEFSTTAEIDRNKISSTTKMIAKYASLDKDIKKEVSKMLIELGKLIQSELSFFNIFSTE